jgi:hypothetical protein
MAEGVEPESNILRLICRVYFRLNLEECDLMSVHRVVPRGGPQNQGLRRIGVEADPEGLWPAPRWLVRAHSIYSAAWPWLAGSACSSIS